MLQEIEHESDALFASVGMPEIYEMGNVMPADELSDAPRASAWPTTYRSRRFFRAELTPVVLVL